MFSLFDKSLVTFLTLLQLIAPLVHAHTGAAAPHAGLHVPGLEAYSVFNRIPVFETISSDQSSDCAIVAVNAGIKPSVCHQPADNGVALFLPLQPPAINLSVYPFYNNFSPPELLPARQVFYSPTSPRAPPAA